MFLAVAATALAGTVIHAGDNPGTAVEAVARDAGVPPWDLDPVRLTSLDPHPVLVGAPLVRCAGAPSKNSAIADQVELGAGRYAKGDPERAAAALATADAMVPCLGEPAEASLLGRLYLWRAVIAHAARDDVGAERELMRALSSQPDLAPEPSLGLDALLAAAKSNAGSAALTIDGTIAGTVFVDGKPLTGGLSRSIHLVQVLGAEPFTAVVDLSSANAWLGLPASGDARIGALGETRDPVVAGLAPLVAPDDTWIWTGTRTIALGADRWEVLKHVPAPGPSKAPPVLGAGIGLAGAGAVMLGVGLSMRQGEPAEPDQTTVDRAHNQNAAGRALTAAGGVALGLGAVGIAVSIPLGGSK